MSEKKLRANGQKSPVSELELLGLKKNADLPRELEGSGRGAEGARRRIKRRGKKGVKNRSTTTNGVRSIDSLSKVDISFIRGT